MRDEHPTRDQYIAELKRLVEELSFNGDRIEFDERLSEIDILVYELRQGCFPKLPRGVKALPIRNPEEIHNLLKDILGE